MPDSDDLMEHYEEGEVHVHEGKMYTGEAKVYEDWVHLPEWPIWFPRERIEKVEQS